MKSKNYMVSKTEAEWKKQLSSEEYHVLRQKGTEPPFTGVFNDHYQKGTYTCKGCGQPLYDSTSKFKSSCGWPSFDEAIPGSIEYIKDISHGMLRTEIVCSKCSSHQGHIFNDGTTKTGDRYCVNAASIDFTEVKD
ncbi:peptide-methionine (R)-S-oxide reductase MsrB [Flavobacteriaceae bacterium]|nr:peptide-methionine (R)-S-oxide reductase MsrB [Flavobacteriaceae bacterium]